MIPLPTIVQHAAATPDRPAVIDDEGALSWASYAEDVRLVAQHLARRLDPADRQRAVLVGDNSAAYIVLASALSTLGIPRVGLDPAGAPNVLAHQLHEVGPTVLAGNSDQLASLADAIGSLPRRPMCVCLDEWPPLRPEQMDAHVERDDIDGCDEWVKPPFSALGFTSGTTDLPKLVVRTSPSEARRTAYFVDRYGFGPDDTHLVTVPLAHASSHGWASLFLTVGATVVVTADPTPDTLIDLAVTHRARTTLMVPPVLAAVVAAAERRPCADLHALRFVLTGGRQVPPRLVRRTISRLGPVLTSYYGTTETGVNLVADSHDLLVKPLTCGRPVPGTFILLLDEDHKPVRLGRAGRVAVSSYMAMSGYGDRPGDCVEHSGRRYLLAADYGRLDAHLQLTLLGRDDGLPGAATVPVIPIEADLLEIEELTDAAVVRTASRQGAPVVTAAIVCAPDADVEQLMVRAEWVLDYHLAQGQPRRVAVVDAIPYGPTGKVRVDDLRQEVDGIPVVRSTTDAVHFSSAEPTSIGALQ
jgi:acyl-CoA synthetase (AMP-forming)/AMP-acid ligase II